MNLGSWLIDKKIRGLNLSLDLNIQEYWSVAENILTKNELQRRKEQPKGNVYTLLRRDLLQGCIMPPIILAVTEQFGTRIAPLVTEVVAKGFIDDNSHDQLNKFIGEAFENKELIILDGLQRSYTIKAALEDSIHQSQIEALKNHIIRVEVYLGLSKMGILYRMLTLNTGQTPMSFRHQLEMLYNDYIDTDKLPDGITVVREIDESRARGLGKYKFSDVIDLFYSYSTGTPQSFDKETLVTQLKELDFLENYQSDTEDMLTLLQLYNHLINHINTISDGWEYQKDEYAPDQLNRAFGVSVPSIFSKVQAMTGFGSACKKLIKTNIYTNLTSIYETITNLSFCDNPPSLGLGQLLIVLDEISQSAKRIGDAQRAYFEVAFREILNPNSDSFGNLNECWVVAQEKYNILY
ncbi:hypothetical protein SAMN02799624_03735 [Paenibacillus sp. UNC496MF]|uniref:hypothetical protein n=1 Tax=Paenibacillus sp. UNC496MF TaxID=1502753 RepID=UPI0008EBCA35|nr:hypothetical protein [Paenibacillus sp. UNC496MF]SFJ23215.1 hypothetical protein SAMN02799624_03735 [Paenibacillus sp. UNC496MF]